MARSNCTLKDVALACHVSTYTVSRAVNDKKDISQATRKHILAVAEKMGYVMSADARNLKTGKSDNIAIIYDDFSNPYYNELIKKLAYKLHEYHLGVTLFYDFASISVLSAPLLQRALSTNVAGVLSLIGVSEEAKRLNAIWKKPLLQLGAANVGSPIDCVYFDDESGGYQAASRLIKQGCRHLGFINSTEKLISGQRRIAGYKRALKEAGLPVDDSFIIHLDASSCSVEEALDRLLKIGADSIVCFNDISALLVLRHLNSLAKTGIQVVGFDNIEQDFPLPSHLDSVYGDLDQLVDIAVKTLLRRIDNESFPFISEKILMKFNS